MKKQEKECFKALCSFKTPSINEELLKYATPSVLGQLFMNRMQGVAYDVLKKNGMLKNVNREFRTSLKDAYENNLKKNTSFFWSLGYVSEILSKSQCNYAMLKGAYLCKEYPEGYRTSNDIDILVSPKDITKIGNTLTQAGFAQGHIRNGAFVPASRKEIIESRMMRGETVPYIKEIWMPSMRFLEVDINFSLDYKPANTNYIDHILSSACIKEYDSFKISITMTRKANRPRR